MSTTYYTKAGIHHTHSPFDISTTECFHRLDGPALIVEYFNEDYIEYWVNGNMIETLEVEDWIKENNINLKTKAHQVLFMLKFG